MFVDVKCDDTGTVLENCHVWAITERVVEIPYRSFGATYQFRLPTARFITFVSF
jgi:hypothetical protein